MWRLQYLVPYVISFFVYGNRINIQLIMQSVLTGYFQPEEAQM